VKPDLYPGRFLVFINLFDDSIQLKSVRQQRNISDNNGNGNRALDELESAAYKSCVQERIEAGYFFLYFNGPVLLLSCLLLGYAGWQNYQPPKPQPPVSQPTLQEERSYASATALIGSRGTEQASRIGMETNTLGKFGIFAGTVSASVLLEGMNIFLYLQRNLGWEGAIKCNNVSKEYVSHGLFLGTFPCIDRTIGGDDRVNPGYTWIQTSIIMYFLGAALGVTIVAIQVALLLAPSHTSYSADQRTQRYRQFWPS